MFFHSCCFLFWARSFWVWGRYFCLSLFLLPALSGSYAKINHRCPWAEALPLFTFSSFTVSDLKFRFLVYGKQSSNFIILHTYVQFCQHCLRNPFFNFCSWQLCQKNQWALCRWINFYILHSVSVINVLVLMSIACHLNFCSFVVCSKITYYGASSLIFLLLGHFDYSVYFWFWEGFFVCFCFVILCMSFRIFFSNSIKNITGILVGIALNLYIALGSIDTFLLITPIQ